MVILEAMASGLPIVASKVDGIPEIIENQKTGVLVPPAEPQALAAAILELLQLPDRRKALGRRARRHVEKNFFTEKMLDQYEQLYVEVLA